MLPSRIIIGVNCQNIIGGNIHVHVIGYHVQIKKIFFCGILKQKENKYLKGIGKSAGIPEWSLRRYEGMPFI